MSTILPPAQLSLWEKLSTLCDKNKLIGLAAIPSAFIGSLYGQGVFVRLGSNLIYNRVFSETINGSSWLFSNRIAAEIIADSSVGAMNPLLSQGGAIIGGAIGGLAGSLAMASAIKIGSYVLDKLSCFSGFNNKAMDEAVTTNVVEITPQGKPTSLEESTTDVDMLSNNIQENESVGGAEVELPVPRTKSGDSDQTKDLSTVSSNNPNENEKKEATPQKTQIKIIRSSSSPSLRQELARASKSVFKKKWKDWKDPILLPSMRDGKSIYSEV